MMAAVTYFIAGKSNCPFFAKAQRIGEIISRNLPAVAVRVNSQHPQEWPAYLDSLCDRLSFNHQTSPIVYTHLGTLIGGSDAFSSLVNKMYGNVAEFPSTVLNDIASENHEQATKEMQKKEAQAQNKKHQEEWDMRNERLEALKGQVMVYLKSNIENVTQLFQSCQNAKATITVVPDKLSTLGELAMLQKHLEVLSTQLPQVDQVTSEGTSLSTLAESLSAIPCATPNSTSRFSRTPDTIWKLMFLDHQKMMNEFLTTLTRMHEANQTLQEEANKATQNNLRAPPALPAVETLSLTSTSEPSSFAIHDDKLHKSVSYAGVDTKYSAKNPAAYRSLPSTPKKSAREEMKASIPSTVIASQLIDVGPIEDAIKAMRVAVEEGLGILKHAKKQLRINENTATMQVSTLRSVLDHDVYRYFKLRERKEIGKNVHLYRFELPSPTDGLGCPMGKHIKVKIGDIERAYSPITTDHDLGYFDLLVKVTRDTPMMALFSSMAPGDWIPIRGPLGTKVFKEGEKVSGIAMFAHGVGLTPMLQVIGHYLSQDETTPLWLLYFNSEEKMLMKDELERLSVANTRFNLRLLPCKPGNHWEHLEAHDLLSSLPFRPSGFDFTSEPSSLKILLCGTKNFTKKTKALLGDMGYRDEVIHTFE